MITDEYDCEINKEKKGLRKKNGANTNRSFGLNSIETICIAQTSK